MKLTIETFVDKLQRFTGADFGFTLERQTADGSGVEPIDGWVTAPTPALGTPVTVTIEWADVD